MQEVHSKAEIYRDREQSRRDTFGGNAHCTCTEEIYRAREQDAIGTNGGNALYSRDSWSKRTQCNTLCSTNILCLYVKHILAFKVTLSQLKNPMEEIEL